jgi:hypothetical protein
MIIHGLPQRFEVEIGQRVDEVLTTGNSHLKQAKLLRIGMQRVSLRIESDPF